MKSAAALVFYEQKLSVHIFFSPFGSNLVFVLSKTKPREENQTKTSAGFGRLSGINGIELSFQHFAQVPLHNAEVQTEQGDHPVKDLQESGS